MVAVSTILFMLFVLCESNGVTHWRIQEEIIQAVHANTVITSYEVCDTCGKSEDEEVIVYDRELAIILKSVQASKQAPWVPVSHVTSTFSTECPTVDDKSLRLKIKDPKNPSNNRCHVVRKVAPNPAGHGNPNLVSSKADNDVLTCGDPVESTGYDFLGGIAQRRSLQSRPEPEVAVSFRKHETDTSVDMLEVKASLKAAAEKHPMSSSLLVKIADFYRIQGDTLKGMECLRTALYMDPDNAEILLKLAQLLFTHDFYNDVIFLTRRSLHFNGDSLNSWRQYLLLAHTYRRLNKFDDSTGFYKKAVELNPGLRYTEAHSHLNDLSRHGTNSYTLVIITMLVFGVLGIIFYLTCCSSLRHNSSSSTANGDNNPAA